jgi:hypothetical protein
LKINAQDAKKIVDYGQNSYFKHLRLYEYVFNNKTASEIKRINFQQEEAKNAMPLQQALQISKGKPKEGAHSNSRNTHHKESELGSVDESTAGRGSNMVASRQGTAEQMDEYGEDEDQDADAPDQEEEDPEKDITDPDLKKTTISVETKLALQNTV